VRLRYGMNPHQAASVHVISGQQPVQVLSGSPSYINLLDAMNGWQLVREAAVATGLAAAASFKHASPAGAAVSGPVDATAQAAWCPGGNPGPLASAYIRARDADPKSSYGDMIAVSEPVDAELADVLAGVVADGIIAPGYEAGTVNVLAAKKRGSFLVLEADPDYRPLQRERRDVFGLIIEQRRDSTELTAEILMVSAGSPLPPAAVRDALLGLAVARYTQSNSVAFLRDGASVGIGAGQQSRVDCVRLAAGKAAAWWLRRAPAIQSLPSVPGMSRQDRLNWQIRIAEGDMTAGQLAQFGALFPAAAAAMRQPERDAWLARLDGVTMVSDGYLPFRDNVDYASRIGVRYVIEPGGSIRSSEVTEACAEYGMTLVRTGLRLFHH